MCFRPPEVGQIKCPECGQPLSAMAKVCLECGADVSALTEEARSAAFGGATDAPGNITPSAPAAPSAPSAPSAPTAPPPTAPGQPE